MCPMARRCWGPAIRALTVALGLGLLLGACSRDGYTYVENGEEGVFLKVPQDWQVTELDDFDEQPTTNEELADNLAWRVGFNGRGNGTPGIGLPSGVVEVHVLTPDQRDNASVSTARAEVLGADPALAARSELANGDVVNLRLDDDIASDAYWGNRQVFDYEPGDGRAATTFDQVVLYDDETSRLYRLVIRCQTDCYAANRDIIENIVDSLTIE
jgi:hypothetical protein